MKILLLRTIPYEESSPFNHLLRDIYKEFLRNDIKIHRVISVYKGQAPKDVLPLEGKSELISHQVVTVPKTSKKNFILRFMLSLWSTFKLSVKGLKNKDIDIVFVTVPQTAIIPVILAKLKKKKVVLLLQDIWPNNAGEIGVINKSGYLYKILNGLQKWIYRNVSTIITISEDMKNLIVNTGVLKDNIYTAHNWSYSDSIVDIEWEDNLFVNKLQLKKDAFYVVYAGNMGVMQNVEIIVEAANRLKDREDIKFILVGDGINKTTLYEKATELGLKNVMFYPIQPAEIASHIYAMADINIIPLKKGVINTALPSKTAACLSCGKPIIACIDKDSEFAKLLSDYGVGPIVSPDDPDELAKSILEMRNKNESLGEMGIAARKCFEDCFRRSKNVEVYSKVFIKSMGEEEIVNVD